MNTGINWFNRHRPAFHDAAILASILSEREEEKARERAERAESVSESLLGLEQTD